MDIKFAPAFVRLINSLRRLAAGRGNFDEASVYFKRALLNRAMLINYFSSSVKPLVRTAQSKLDIEQFETVIEQTGNILERIEKTLADKDTEGVRTLVKILDENAVKLAVVIKELKKAREDSFKASSVRLISDTILIGMGIIRGEQEPALLATRVLPLQGYIIYVEATIATLKKRYPKETELIDFFQVQLERLRQAAGGIYIFLEEKGTNKDLSNAVSLLDRAGMDLWAAFSALNQLFIADSKYSGDPSVQEFYHQLQQFKAGAIDKNIMKSALGILTAHQQAAALDVARLESFVFLKPDERKQFIPVLTELLDKRDLLMAYIGENFENYDKTMEALDKYNKLTKDFSDRLTALDGVLDARPSLAEASHFKEILELIRLTYEERTSDLQLENKAVFLDEYSNDFLRKLTLQEKHSPETQNHAKLLRNIVQGHKTGLGKVFMYLDSGDKNHLPEAYADIESATLQLLETNEEIRKEAEIQANSTDANVCPYCSYRNPVTEITCLKCKREIFGGGYGGGLLDMTESQGASTGITRDLPENFQFIRQVVEDAASGVISMKEAEEMLTPHWEKLQDTEAQLAESVLPTVEQLNDEELNRCYDEFYDILSYFIQIMQEILGAVQQEDYDGLQQRINPVEETGLELSRLKENLDQLTAKAAS